MEIPKYRNMERGHIRNFHFLKFLLLPTGLMWAAARKQKGLL